MKMGFLDLTEILNPQGNFASRLTPHVPPRDRPVVRRTTGSRLVRIDELRAPQARGSVDDLVESIREVGLLHPITVSSDLRLIAGARRLAACRELGWSHLPVVVLDLDKLRMKMAGLDEDLVRKDLSILDRAEMLAQRKGIYESLHPSTRRGVAGGKASGASRRGERTTAPDAFVRDVSRKTNLAPRTIQSMVQLAHAIPEDVRRSLRGTSVEDFKRGLARIARLPHDQQRAVAKRIATGETPSVRRALALVAAADLERRTLRMPKGKYDVIVVDPPWPYEQDRLEYPTMSIAQIQGLPVGSLAAENCAVWLWTTNAMMRHVYPILDSWGATEKTIMTWHKTRSTLGDWLLNTTEHAILATIGKPIVTLKDQTTILKAPNRQHSRKPDAFFKLVESLCPGRKLELFARESRAGWSAWGAERNHFDRAA
jgi:N6-adenosine-specific RNA methylase IME4